MRANTLAVEFRSYGGGRCGAVSLVPPLLLFTGLIAYDVLNFGARFVNVEGRLVPRSGRALMYLGLVSLVLSTALFHANTRRPASSAGQVDMQIWVDSLFTVGVVFLGPLYLGWMLWKHRDLLAGEQSADGAEEQSPHRHIGRPFVGMGAGAAAGTVAFILLAGIYVNLPNLGVKHSLEDIGALKAAGILIFAVVIVVATLGVAIRKARGPLDALAVGALLGGAVWCALLSVAMANLIAGPPSPSGAFQWPVGKISSTHRFEPKMDFVADKSFWGVADPETEDNLVIARHDYSPAIVFHNVDDVYDLRAPHWSAKPAPGNLAAWYESHPHLRVLASRTVSLGGARGLLLDAKVTSTPKIRFDWCQVACVPLFPTNDGRAINAYQGQWLRVLVLEVKGETVAISIHSPSKEDLRHAEEVLRTVRWKALAPE